MKDFKIKVKRRELPYRITLRAMLKFKQLTGRDWGALEGNGITDLITFLWCCVWATCAVDGVEFTDDIEEFTGHLDGSVFSRWMKYLSDSNKQTVGDDEGGGKKSTGIEELIAFGTVNAGLSRGDVLAMTIEEFAEIEKAYVERQKAETYAKWDRVRTLAAIVIQPHCKRKITPRQLLLLPGDKAKKAAKGSG
ncbi:MAG: hypothetical protein K2J65_11110 [Duncaniella sp.]|nr:hypothetical protein [Duncaniella sp.]